ncbi:MAG: hypothetical protein IPN42_19265 [Methylococcaceae bacterium]|nr:hypothetical protein [Methylococcaceae bacterium]
MEHKRDNRPFVTPGDGIQDHFVTLSGKLSGIQLSAVYHCFLSYRDNYDYGHEWDFWPNGLSVHIFSLTLSMPVITPTQTPLI